MKLLLKLLLCLAALLSVQAHAQQRLFNQAELDALLAPVALYPDPLLSHILAASVYPQDVAEAARTPAAAPNALWHPSVKELVNYPDLLARMAESPQWVSDLGQAYMSQQPEVSATVQQLRVRAEASGNLRSNEQQYVYHQADTIVVQPAYTNYVYAPYYNPYVVYGGWWWPAYRPVYFRPWVARPVYVRHVTYAARPVIVQRPVVVHRPVQVQVRPYHAVPESRRQPIVSSQPRVTQQIRPIANGQQHQSGSRSHGGGHGGGHRRGG